MPSRSRPTNPARATNAAPDAPDATPDPAHIAALHERVCRIVGIPTLQDRNRDMLDFHSVGVATLREIVQTAFDAGVAAASGAARGSKARPNRP